MPAVLPAHVVVVLTLAMGQPDDSEALFRPFTVHDGGWTSRLTHQRRYNDFHAALAEELQAAGPRFTAEVKRADLLAAASSLPSLVSLRASFRARPVRLSLEDASLGVTEVGYGAISLTYLVHEIGPGGMETGMMDGGEIVDLALASSIQKDAVVLADGFLAKLQFVSKRPANSTALWGHILYMFASAERLPLSLLAPDAERVGEELVLAFPDGLFKPGLGSSVIAGQDADRERRAIQVLTLVSAYYAAAAESDRRIFRYLQRATHRTEGQAVLYDRLFEEVSVFRAVIATFDVHLAASIAFEVRLWDCYSEAWRFSLQLAALNDKLGLLRTFQEREAARLAVHRSNHLAAVAAVFTVMGFVGTMLALVDFGQAPPLSVPNLIRSALSVVFVAGIVVLFVIWNRRRSVPAE